MSKKSFKKAMLQKKVEIFLPFEKSETKRAKNYNVTIREYGSQAEFNEIGKLGINPLANGHCIIGVKAINGDVAKEMALEHYKQLYGVNKGDDDLYRISLA